MNQYALLATLLGATPVVAAYAHPAEEASAPIAAQELASPDQMRLRPSPGQVRQDAA